MTGRGFGWNGNRIAWEIAKLIEPVSSEAVAAGKVTYTEALATEWVQALSDGGLTEGQALDLFAKRIQERNGYTASIIIDATILPYHLTGDRYFRDAIIWEDTEVNKWRFDMTRAQIIHMDHIRVARDLELVKLDVMFIRAIETNDMAEQVRITALKQSLRDIPQAFDLSIYVTPETLKAAWPTELPLP